jgi:hypothetical protein
VIDAGIPVKRESATAWRLISAVSPVDGTPAGFQALESVQLVPSPTKV